VIIKGLVFGLRLRVAWCRGVHVPIYTATSSEILFNPVLSTLLCADFLYKPVAESIFLVLIT